MYGIFAYIWLIYGKLKGWIYHNYMDGMGIKAPPPQKRR